MRAYTLDILKHSRELLVRREARHRIRRLHFPRVKLKKWLFTNNDSGPEVRASTHKSDMEENDRIDREKSKVTKIPRKQEKVKSLLTTILLAWLEFRKILGHTLAWIQNSDSFLYATKFTFGVMLLSWPAFVASWASWYYTARGGKVLELTNMIMADVKMQFGLPLFSSSSSKVQLDQPLLSLCSAQPEQ